MNDRKKVYGRRFTVWHHILGAIFPDKEIEPTIKVETCQKRSYNVSRVISRCMMPRDKCCEIEKTEHITYFFPCCDQIAHRVVCWLTV